MLRCATKHKLPEPTRLADRLAGEAKRRMLAATLEMIVEQRAGEPGRWEWVPDEQRVVFRARAATDADALRLLAGIYLPGRR